MRNRNRPRLPLNALRAFEAVAHHLNFGLGARSLHVTQSAVSRHIAALEAMLDRCGVLKERQLVVVPAACIVAAAGASR